METTSVVRAEGERAPFYSHIYNGKFTDRNRNIKAAGILTYAPGDNVKETIRQSVNSAPIKYASTIQKFRNYSSPGLSEMKIHYGHANDPKDYEQMSHGLRSDTKSFTSKDCVNPQMLTRFQNLKNEMNERIYQSKKSAPLGRVPLGNLPAIINPLEARFGVVTNTGESAKEIINPNKPRHQVELETSDKHEMYVFSHKDYEPGEQKDRVFSDTFDRYKRFGVETKANYDGKMTKESLNWLPLRALDKRAQFDALPLDEFREKHTSQVGKSLDPNKETRFLGPDHVFGLNNQTDSYTAGDVIHGRPEEKKLKGRDKERAYLVSIRSHLARYNYLKFKNLIDAFKFYDKDKDGFVSRDELKTACALTDFSVSDELLDILMHECDYDHDGKINFLEFSNFLCYKDSMKPGNFFKDPNDSSDKDLKDDEGRILLKESDLAPKNNIAINELVPRTLVNQIDSKVGNWKTNYDVINDAPFRMEPMKKRVYGVPSIRNDLVPPSFKKIQDRTNYGNDGTVWSMVSPSVYSQNGVYENDMLKPRSKSEMQEIFKSTGVDLSANRFENAWNTAKSLNPQGLVSVEEFRTALNQC